MTQQKKYKAYHDKKVRQVLKLKGGDEVFIDAPPSTGQAAAERLSDEPHGKLRKKTTGSGKVLEVFDTTARIALSDGLEDIISFDRLTKAPPPLDPQTLKPQQSEVTASPSKTPPLPASPSNSSPPATTEHALQSQQPSAQNDASKEYVVERIVDYEDIDDGPRYLVHWYQYNDPKDYTWEPTEHIPANMR